MYQQTTIIGNLGSEPELKYTQTGVALCSFSVAVNERYTVNGEARQNVTWFRVTAWRSLAEVAAQYLTKGRLVMVVGSIKASAYTDKGNKAAASLELTANTIKFLGSRNNDDDGVYTGDQVVHHPDDAENIPF